MTYTDNEEIIIAATISLAAVCDYATSQDGQGYNGRDTEFMHSVVEQHNNGRRLTQKQLRAMYKTLRIYKNQLMGFDINYDEITRPDEEVIQIESTGVIDPTWESFRINFGKKHKGESIAAIWKADPDYVEWLSRESFMEDVKLAAQCVIDGKPIRKPGASEPVDSVLGDFELDFGKFAGLTMGEIWLKEPSYIKWLANESYMDDVRNNAQAIIDNDPEHIKQLKEQLVNKKELVKLSTATASDSDFKMKPGFGRDKKTLYPYQLVAAEFIERSGGCAMVCDTVGLGKSPEAMTFIHNNPEKRPVIIVAPASVKHQWYDYCYEWLKTDDIIEVITGTRDQFIGDIIILNYDILKKNLKKLKELNPQIIIYDEFHKIKNYKTQRTIAATDLALNVPHKILLSGTPWYNATKELWPPLCVVDPKKYNEQTFFPWHKKYCGAKKTYYGWDFSGNTNTEELAEELKHIMIRRTEEDVFDDLPELIRTVIPITISNRHIYNKAKENHIAWIREEKGKLAADRAERAEHLTRIEYLKQLVAEGKTKYTIQWIEDYLTSEDKLVIFTMHKTVTAALMEKFKDSALKIDGSISTGKERLDIAKRFETDPKIKIIVCNMIAASEGLNFGVSKAVLFLEQGWSPKLHEQCEGRIKGLRQAGRDRKLIYSYYIVGYDTIDMEISAMLESKRKAGDMAMGDTVKLNFNFFSSLVK